MTTKYSFIRKSKMLSMEDNCVLLTNSLTLQDTSVTSTYKNGVHSPYNLDLMKSKTSSNSFQLSESSSPTSSNSSSEIKLSVQGNLCQNGEKANESISDNETSSASSALKIKSTKKIFKRSKQHPPDPDSLPPCRVCGEKASGLHYGVNTCEPCKGFFRRSIVKIHHNKEKYTCIREGGNCKLGTGKRTQCSYCRYMKCLEVGMSQDAIKIGRYTYNKRTNDFLEVSKLKGNEHHKTTGKPDQIQLQVSGKHVPNPHQDTLQTNKQNPQDKRIVEKPKGSLPKDIEERLACEQHNDCSVDTEETDSLVEKLIEIQEEVLDDFRLGFVPDGLLEKQLQIYEQYQRKVELFGSLGALPKSIYDEFQTLTGIEIDDRKAKRNMITICLEKYILNMVKFARNLPGFTSISQHDQAVLLKASFYEFWFLGVHNRINAKLNVVVLGNTGIPGDGGAHLSEFSNTMEGDHCNKSTEYAIILQKCNFTVEELTITRGIILTSTDRVKLEEPDKVEKIQWNLINALRYVCQKNYKNPDERIWQIFDKFSTLRSYAETAHQSSKMKAQWPVMQDHPLVLEILLPDSTNHEL